MSTPRDNSVPKLPLRRSGIILRTGAKFHKGIAKVQAQIAPYADKWHEHNLREVSKTEPLWVVLGDSMSQGIGASDFDKGWVGQLRQHMKEAGLQYKLVNLSLSGARTEHVLDMQLPAMRKLATKPALITILIGSNDIFNPRYRRNVIANFHKIIDELPETDIIISPIGDFKHARKITEILRHYDSKGKIRMTAGTVSDWRGKIAEDHFHPNDHGYAEIAKVFADTILDTQNKR